MLKPYFIKIIKMSFCTIISKLTRICSFKMFTYNYIISQVFSSFFCFLICYIGNTFLFLYYKNSFPIFNLWTRIHVNQIAFFACKYAKLSASKINVIFSYKLVIHHFIKCIMSHKIPIYFKIVYSNWTFFFTFDFGQNAQISLHPFASLSCFSISL